MVLASVYNGFLLTFRFDSLLKAELIILLLPLSENDPQLIYFCEATGMGTTGGAKAYTLAEVSAATMNFKTELGKGGFGPVYYGRLPDGQEVAVKVADGSSKQGEKEFFNEVCCSLSHQFLGQFMKPDFGFWNLGFRIHLYIL